MSTRRIVLSAVALPFMGACGGSPGSGPHSEVNLYDRQLLDLQAASATVDAGATALGAWAQEAMLSQPVFPTLHIDPITQQPRWSDVSTGTSYRYWFVAAGVVGVDGKPLATLWQPRTIWLLKGTDYVSSRDLKVQDNVFFATFAQPPFSREGVVVVVELVQGATTRLSAAPPIWLG